MANAQLHPRPETKPGDICHAEFCFCNRCLRKIESLHDSALLCKPDYIATLATAHFDTSCTGQFPVYQKCPEFLNALGRIMRIHLLQCCGVRVFFFPKFALRFVLHANTISATSARNALIAESSDGRFG